MINYLITNWDTLLTLILCVCGAIYAIVTRQTGVINGFILSLLTEAEKSFGPGTGALKKSTVISWIIDKIPGFLRPFFSEKNLSDLIENALDGAKNKWKVNPQLLDD